MAKNKSVARKEVIGKSLDHWDIPAIFITNEALPNDDKQIAVITLGRHGQSWELVLWGLRSFVTCAVKRQRR